MNDKHQRLKAARERAGYVSAKAAAEAIGVSPASYTQHESGLRGFSNSLAERYAAFFKVPLEWLVHGTRRTEVESFIPLGPRIYVKGEVAAGMFKEAWEIDPDQWEVFTGRADVAAPIRERFGLRVVGESMDMVYPPGSILECVRYSGQDITSGKRVIVQRVRDDDRVETTVKEYIVDAAGVPWLVPRSSNPALQAPIRADKPEPGIVTVEIFAIVVASIRPE
ncbi:MAG: XRE family transcriptional regulator [Rhodospirillales bacterium]|nr:XRE family transcriptional regulator [Rhodospirillales bacterium]